MSGQRSKSSVVFAVALALAGCADPRGDRAADAETPMLQLRPGAFTVNHVPASGACPANAADWKTVTI